MSHRVVRLQTDLIGSILHDSLGWNETLTGLAAGAGFVAVAFVFINLGSVCAHCLYNGAVRWGQLSGRTMRRLTVILGAIGVLLAVAGI